MAYRDPGKVLIVVGFTLTAFSTLVVGLRLVASSLFSSWSFVMLIYHVFLLSGIWTLYV